MAISKYRRLSLSEEELKPFKEDLERLPCLEAFGGTEAFIVEKVIQLVRFKEKIVALAKVFQSVGGPMRYMVFVGVKNNWETVISNDPGWSNLPPIFNFRKEPGLLISEDNLYIGGEDNFEIIGDKKFLHLAI